MVGISNRTRTKWYHVTGNIDIYIPHNHKMAEAEGKLWKYLVQRPAQAGWPRVGCSRPVQSGFKLRIFTASLGNPFPYFTSFTLKKIIYLNKVSYSFVHAHCLLTWWSPLGRIELNYHWNEHSLDCWNLAQQLPLTNCIHLIKQEIMTKW